MNCQKWHLQLACYISRWLTWTVDKRTCIPFQHFHQTHMDAMYLSCSKHFWSPYTVCARHIQMVLMVVSCETSFWNVFGPLFPISFWKATPHTVPYPANSWQLTWFTKTNAMQWKTDAITCCELTETLRISLADYIQIVCQCLIIKVLFISKFVKIIIYALYV